MGTLCDAVGHEKISIRDLPEPKWCEALPRTTTHARRPTFASARRTRRASTAPSTPSTPYTCVNAGLIGLTQDLRYTPEKLGLSDHSTREWNLKHHVTSKTHPAGHTEYPVCDMYAQDKDECKRSYQTDGDVY